MVEESFSIFSNLHSYWKNFAVNFVTDWFSINWQRKVFLSIKSVTAVFAVGMNLFSRNFSTNRKIFHSTWIQTRAKSYVLATKRYKQAWVHKQWQWYRESRGHQFHVSSRKPPSVPVPRHTNAYVRCDAGRCKIPRTDEHPGRQGIFRVLQDFPRRCFQREKVIFKRT